MLCTYGTGMYKDAVKVAVSRYGTSTKMIRIPDYQKVSDPDPQNHTNRSWWSWVSGYLWWCGLEERQLPAVAPLLSLHHLGRDPRTFLTLNDSFPLILPLIPSFLFVNSWPSFLTDIRTVCLKFGAVFQKRERRFVIFANCRQFRLYSTHDRRFGRPIVWLPSQLLVFVKFRALVTETEEWSYQTRYPILARKNTCELPR